MNVTTWKRRIRIAAAMRGKAAGSDKELMFRLPPGGQAACSATRGCDDPTAVSHGRRQRMASAQQRPLTYPPPGHGDSKRALQARSKRAPRTTRCPAGTAAAPPALPAREHQS
jgi:hypothetical protein